MRRCSTSCTSAPSRRRARSAPRSASSIISPELGVTALEIMPVADFPGRRNWGYDGVLPYAPDSTYGRPEDLKALIEAAHERGLMVLLDVVYNHFGPDGQLPPRLRPAASSPSGTRRPGARPSTTTAQHAEAGARVLHPQRPLLDRGVPSRRAAARRRARDRRTTARSICWTSSPSACAPQIADRHVHLVLENEDNEAQTARARRGRQAALLHGAMERRRPSRAARRRDRRGQGLLCRLHRRYRTTRPRSGGGLRVPGRGHALSRRAARRAQRAACRPTAFVAFIQNHDQVGNRAFGERIDCHRADPRRCAPSRRCTCCCRRSRCCSWARNGPLRSLSRSSAISAASSPTPCAKGGARSSPASRSSRTRAMRERIPDPQAEATFASAKLDWDEPASGAPCRLGSTGTAACSRVRRAEIVPRLAGDWRQCGALRGHRRGGGAGALAPWRRGGAGARGQSFGEPREGFPAQSGRILWQEGAADGDRFGPWTVRWSSAMMALMALSAGRGDPQAASQYISRFVKTH